MSRRVASSEGEPVHVYFYALPLGERFIHQGEPYTKTGDEEATDAHGEAWTFEAHYGAVISSARAEALGLPTSALRPADRPAQWRPRTALTPVQIIHQRLDTEIAVQREAIAKQEGVVARSGWLSRRKARTTLEQLQAVLAALEERRGYQEGAEIEVQQVLPGFQRSHLGDSPAILLRMTPAGVVAPGVPRRSGTGLRMAHSPVELYEVLTYDLGLLGGDRLTTASDLVPAPICTRWMQPDLLHKKRPVAERTYSINLSWRLLWTVLKDKRPAEHRRLRGAG